ncbi:MAG: hypothetical protein BMS9Abin02_2077 [Anaerolineae bacterium]|nr:MAG: hypothetical protein BMS9Abin02_2077 [Anaerolineae bacterium]
MKLEITIPLWVLATSYWIHLLATVTWLGGLMMMTVVALPAVRDRIMEADQWVQLQRRSAPWANASLVILWVTGFLQLTADTNYEGFLAFDSLWAQAILIKHIAVIAMMVLALYIQWRIYPALSRIALLEKKRPQMAGAERKRLADQEIRLVRLNLICAAAVLLFTAVATAI